MALSLLLADDSPTIAKILGMALQSEDYEIRSALTAEDAVKELYAQPPFFFLVDLTLPGKNGYEFARLIRADRKLKDVRVLLLASAFDPADENEVRNSGANGVIEKPFDPGELRRRLRQVRDTSPTFTGAEPQGSLSGTAMPSPRNEAAPPAFSPAETSSQKPAPFTESEETDPLAALSPAGDADSILSSALSEEASDSVPVFDLSSTPDSSEFTNATVLLEGVEATPTTPILDLSQSFGTPPRGTALLEVGPISPEPPPRPPAEEPLSANAQALAAFFSAELDAHADVQPPPPPPAEDAFDASLSSIEWGAPKADLSDWQSAPSPKAAMAEPQPNPREPERAVPIAEFSRPAPSPETRSNQAAPRPSAPTEPQFAGASSEGGSFLFDTGGSNFRFAEDYIHRITKAFTGSTDEMTLGRDASTPVFHRASDGRPATSAPEPKAASASPSPAAQPEPAPVNHAPMGGGAWSPEEVKRIEQIVRDEVQMVVREIAEKVVWEVVPELAENLIKKELEKVLKEMDEES